MNVTDAFAFAIAAIMGRRRPDSTAEIAAPEPATRAAAS
jgi:hypothetical protein